MYLGEIRLNWQVLLAASTGIALGAALSHYTLSLFGPPLIEEFGWARSQFALVGSLPLLTVIFVPLAGRFTDRFGPRLSALIGFSAMALGFLAFSLMRGGIAEFFAIYLVQHIFGILTTSLVFARVVVERFDAARGIALSMLMVGPPLAGAILAPVLGDVIQDHGWRAGYLTLAAISAIGGGIAVALMGKGRKAVKSGLSVRLTRQEFWGLVRQPSFLFILGGMFLVNLPQVFASSQLKLVALDRGVADDAANWLLSLYAVGIIVGRFATGLALDKFDARVVACCALGLPTVGLAVLALPVEAFGMLAAAILVVGLAQGAEGDIGAYMVSRQFDLKNYSLLLSLVTVMITAGAAAGSLLLSFTLAQSGSYAPFLLIAAILTAVGAALFAMTGRSRNRAESENGVDSALAEQAASGEIA